MTGRTLEEISADAERVSAEIAAGIVDGWMSYLDGRRDWWNEHGGMPIEDETGTPEMEDDGT